MRSVGLLGSGLGLVPPGHGRRLLTPPALATATAMEQHQLNGAHENAHGRVRVPHLLLKVAEAVGEAHAHGQGQEAVPKNPPVELHLTLEQLYDDLEEVFYSKRGSRISAKEQRLIESTGGSPTYGELLAEGVDQLQDILGDVPDDSVFMDLGSGLGRVVLQLALAGVNRPNQFNRLYGLELSVSRLEQSEHVLNRLRQIHSEQDKSNHQGASAALNRVEFVEADVTISPLLKEATHVFMCSTAFGSVACRRIVEQLHESEKFQVLITSRELPFQPHLRRLGGFPLACSWHAASTGHVYVRHDLTNAPQHLLRRYCSDPYGAMCWLPNMYRHVPFAVQEPLAGFKVSYLPQDVTSSGNTAAHQ